jgi:hypothetical protein
VPEIASKEAKRLGWKISYQKSEFNGFALDFYKAILANIAMNQLT